MARKPPNRMVECRLLPAGSRAFPASQLRFRAAAYGIALDGEGRVLLGRSVFHGLWELPGGAVEPWETLPEGLAREYREETGLQAVVEEPVGFDEAFIAFFQYPFHSLRFFYRVTVDPSQPLVPQTGEVRELQWLPVATLTEEMLAHGQLTFIRRATGGVD